jgi:glucokinase
MPASKTSRTATPLVGLVGDVGGTHARFALVLRLDGRMSIEQPFAYRVADYVGAHEVVSAYLSRLNLENPPAFAVVAAAGPIAHGAVTFTNNAGWSLSEHGLAEAGGFKRARLINDFTAQALAIEHLRPTHLHRLGAPEDRPARGTTVVLGAGTGFGVAARVDDGRARATLTGEGGHCGFSPGDDVEIEIIRRLMARYGRVSIERVLSGPGLLNLYRILADIRGEPAPFNAPDQVTRHALAGDRLSRLALDRFCAILGSVAGDFALAYGAGAGVYISGGIAPGILDCLAASDFRRRFESKGRMSDYLKPIATWVVLEPLAALIGAASLLDELAHGA